MFSVVRLSCQQHNEYTMKLSNIALTRISERKILLALALSLDFTEQWMRRVIENNKENGPLTTAKALMTIKEQTGLGDAEILEEGTPEPSAK